jgi:hypothetical protein
VTPTRQHVCQHVLAALATLHFAVVSQMSVPADGPDGMPGMVDVLFCEHPGGKTKIELFFQAGRSHECRPHRFLPLQGGGQEGDGV